ncbi:MAG: AAA family ATPase [Erysipelotrichaceae bacterium]|nr:AAA family ATPase [Erysipelotrichaceae bacterium]
MIDFKIYYSLEFNPFEKGQEDIQVDTNDFKEATARLNYLRDIRGIGLFTGRSGTGKTFCLKKFSETLNPGLYQVVYMPMSTLTTIEFYRELSLQLGLETYHKKIDNFRSIQSHIKDMVDEKRIVPVIILDEAQFLGTSILNDLIMLLNFDFDSKNYVILIISGTPVLNITMNKAVHEALKQRIVIQYDMAGMDEKDIGKYIDEKLKKAGRRDPLFRDDAVSALLNACQGSSRKLNNLLTHCLIIGATEKKMIIDNEVVMDAANEIG